MRALHFFAALLLGLTCAACRPSPEPSPPAPTPEAPPVAAPAPSAAPDLDALIQEVVAGKAQMGLPRAFDGYTVEDVTAAAGTLTFHTRLDAPRDPALDTLRTQAMLTPVLAARVCAEPPSRALLDRGGVYAYRFVDVNGRYVTKVYVTRGACVPAALP